ncbi:MAG: hypothetical protein QUV05_21740 [Phycisphaerae bacterium]|nr:hypothetical protein [Phycisphaerae bacterium]
MRDEPCHILLMVALAAAVAGVIPASSAQPTSTAPAASRPAGRAVNPHWSGDGCRHCHKLQENRVLPVDPKKINELCWQCHDGTQAARDVHPVGRLFASQQVRRPDHWPAPGGALSCVTCHDIRLACDHPLPRPTLNASFLRPVSGQGPMAFCAECHVDAFRPGEGRHNAHVMLDAAGRQNPDACRFCHAPSFRLDGPSLRTGTPLLRADGISLCASCHTRHVDYFEPGHIGHEVAEPMRSRMLALEPVLWAARPLLPQSRPAGGELTRLPLENERRIVCTTCHNPHQEGTFAEWSVLADGAIPLDREKPHARLRGLNKDLCYACHE